MKYPDFFDAIPRIVLRDPLAEFLGAADGGLIEYSYLDAVKLAGHSCPTVASAFCLTRRAMRALYGDALPERGGLRVAFSASAADGVHRGYGQRRLDVDRRRRRRRVQGDCRVFRTSFPAVIQRGYSV